MHTPAEPWQSAGRKPAQVPVTRPVQLGALLHDPLIWFWHSPAKALQVWAWRPPQACAIVGPVCGRGTNTLELVCGNCGPVCGHDGLVGSHQRMFSFS